MNAGLQGCSGSLPARTGVESSKPWPNPVCADVSGDCHADIKESRFSENATLVFILLCCMKWHAGLLQGLVCCLCSRGKVCQAAGLPAADSMGDDELDHLETLQQDISMRVAA